MRQRLEQKEVLQQVQSSHCFFLKQIFNREQRDLVRLSKKGAIAKNLFNCT
ncbi:hypothetical protein COO91_07874 [Nostoc flagelliforme CCNUN1]|uniref:Uncharacterized protein n=1 Tax=Nostoc flagelliforme CCNUN1 TaxID=2038116 RepID=A0A2K8T295_9NOSO|nr:hypothetical protein COO91_07874 [Nostoc flagelliforme CCNUN1]